ncbi:MAG TPA: peptidylprolyl isomerase [Acidimicrobiales bacterium]|nr:peptidylprolyl isomerase [Acidimicrobiales bacterium]
MSTEKRQRQKAGRNARLEAQKKTAKRKQNLRRVISLVIVAGAIFGIAYWINSSGGPAKKAAAKSSTTTTTKPAPKGGSGDTTPSAITTSANCPATFTDPLNKPSYPSAPPMTISTSKTYIATVTTDVGSFSIQLDPKTAPKAVNSFVYLADQHFFDCIVFHRVIPGFMDQTGDPTGTGSGGPGYTFTDELPKTATPQYPNYSVAMANSGANTNGSQFFIVDGTQGQSLAPSYTLFGKVIVGTSVVDKINADGNATASANGVPPTVLHRIVSVSIAVT